MSRDDAAEYGDGVGRPTIAHLFADHGVETEALSAYGNVFRFTIEPRPNEFDVEAFQIDLMESTPAGRFDLVVCHPKCTKWADMPNVDPEDHENQIPRARQLAEALGEDYIIENKPRAPLEDPTVLTGKMFGLPLEYARAFETSFRVKSPPRERTLSDKTVSPYFFSDRSREWWQGVKGYVGHYPKNHLAKNALPAAYVHCLARSWLESRDTRDGREVQDNNDPAPRQVDDDQAELNEVLSN